MFYAILIIVHVIVSILMIGSILMQASKGKGLAGAFGGAAMASAVLGARGTVTFLVKATTVLAIIFAFNCIVLSVFAAKATEIKSAVQSAVQAPASPADNLPFVPGALQEGMDQTGLPTQTLPTSTIPASTPISDSAK
jgi:preprotein translocase subunit SecG